MVATQRAKDIRVERVSASNRGVRRPQHVWRNKLYPWAITPAFIAPVLAGDTLRRASLQSRTMSGVISDPVTGWWLELYVFYCRLGDLEVADTMRTAIIDPTANMTAINHASAPEFFHQTANRPSWVYECMRLS